MNKDIHTCLFETCKPTITLRQSVRLDIKPYLEDYGIQYHQSLFYPESESEPDKLTLLGEYGERVTYILLKTSGVAFYFDSSNRPYFGMPSYKYYNWVGDLVQYSIQMKYYGQTLSGNNYIGDGNIIKDKTFAIELPQKKGFLEQVKPGVIMLNDILDNIRINLDNSAIKHYFVAGLEDPDGDIKLTTTPSVNNSGIAVVTGEFVPKYNLKELTAEEKLEKSKNLVQTLLSGEENQLIPNRYEDITPSSGVNGENMFRVFTLFGNIKYSAVESKANKTAREVVNVFYSSDLGENFLLKSLKKLVILGNKFTGEDNVLKKTVNLAQELNGQELLEGGSHNELLRKL